ncbi:MAG: response regulator [Desulfobacteraceae bacterium]|nr:MAG: response regulator [Desulfobacteraceae bacterium]
MQELKILVVDDDPVTRALIYKRLSNDEFQVETAESGVDAVRMISQTLYDVVITDMMMPGGIDGIGVLETAKEHNLKTEVILVTAHGTIDNAICAMKKGATDYLQKPINFDELLLRLAKIQNLKNLMKNASDLRFAMEVTEQTSCETIQNLEMMVAALEERLVSMRAVLNRTELSPEERIALALSC